MGDALRRRSYLSRVLIFFFHDTATPEIYTLSLHDALPIYCMNTVRFRPGPTRWRVISSMPNGEMRPTLMRRSEEHTSELQSQSNLVCRLLLEKKNDRTLHLNPYPYKNIYPATMLTS